MGSYVIEVTVKEKCGQYYEKLDHFKDKPEEVVKIITEKYCNRRTFLDWLYTPLEISNKELERLLNARK